MAPRFTDPVPRFLAKFKIGKPDECWVWLAYKDVNGYGHFRPRKWLPMLAHRYSYEHFVRPLREGEVIDHLCRNTSCVNPKHLEAVTMLINTQRGLLKAVQQAKAAKRTHCNRGHEWIEANIRTTKKGRLCAICHDQRMEEWAARNHEHVLELQRQRRAAGGS